MRGEPKQTLAQEPIRWKKLKSPKTWRPKNAGSELVGYYLGKTLKDGQWGQYYVVMVAVPGKDGFSAPYMASGSALIRALDGGQVEVGSFVRIVFGGMKDLGEDRYMKEFEVFVGEGTITMEQAQSYLEQAEESDEDE